MWKRRATAWVVSLVWACLGTSISTTVPWARAEPEASALADLRQIKKFVSVEAQTQGTAERLGISRSGLTDLMRVTLLNRVPGVALEASSGPAADATDRPQQLGFLTCEVWTVGDQYIAAYHVDCSAGAYTRQRLPGALWNQAILGYGPKEEVPEAVRKGVLALVQQFTNTFSRAKTEVSTGEANP
ncbi:MAG TPA: hypothetical protein VFQ34_03455 [Nitrospiraceae bacterium]|nr:hypothetical protein [Nitrospiraceae bacterium]